MNGLYQTTIHTGRLIEMARKLVNFVRSDSNIGRIRWVFRQFLSPVRDQPYRYQNGNRGSTWEPLTEVFIRKSLPMGLAVGLSKRQ